MAKVNSTIYQRYTVTEHLLTGDATAAFNQATLDVGILVFKSFNQVFMKMTKHAFPIHAFSDRTRN